jgi:hypothetical protein
MEWLATEAIDAPLPPGTTEHQQNSPLARFSSTERPIGPVTSTLTTGCTESCIDASLLRQKQQTRHWGVRQKCIHANVLYYGYNPARACA